MIRPIQPEDEPLLVKFHETLSEQSVYQRYFNHLKLDQRVAHERMTRICFNDYDREIALVVERKNGDPANPEILGVGRLSKARGLNEAEFSLLISDSFQHQGIGSELLKRLIQIGRDEKLSRITADILSDNQPMLHVTKRAGFKVAHEPGGNDYMAEYKL
jgi:acetyltransferase